MLFAVEPRRKKRKKPRRSKSSTVRVGEKQIKDLASGLHSLKHSLHPNFHRYQDICFVHLMQTSTAIFSPFYPTYVHKFCIRERERKRERMIQKWQLSFHIKSFITTLLQESKIPFVIQCCSFNITIQLFLYRIWYIPKEISVLSFLFLIKICKFNQ